MAYNDSGELPVSQSIYQLGGYTFELKVQNVHEPGEEEVVSIYAVCRGPDGSRETQASDFSTDTTINSWNVEANETESSVYANIMTIIEGGGGEAIKAGDTIGIDERGKVCAVTDYPHVYIVDNILTSKTNFTISYVIVDETGRVIVGGFFGASGAVYKGKHFYVAAYNRTLDEADIETAFNCLFYLTNPTDTIIGRFEIDLKEAGGGPGGDWDEPGSVEPEPGELTHTLTLTAITALSGRHNDPLNDTSYSYMPADNTTVKPYGCGGDGGHGGGGGGGASSMVVRQIVTDKASHVEYSTRTKRHGYGSGGGKGGKGGDGCILIFY